MLLEKRECENKNTVEFDKAKSFAVLPKGKEKRNKERKEKKRKKRVKTNIAVK